MERMERVDVLLVGGGVTSVRCARTLRRHGFAGSIALIGDERTPPYNRPPLSKELLRDDLPDELALAEPEPWYARRAIDLRLGSAVRELDVEARTAILDDGARINFESCLLATGAEPRVPRIPGAERALLLRTIDDVGVIRAAAHPGTRAVVIGGGFIGVEVASSLATLGVEVTVVELTGMLWSGLLGAELASWALKRLEGAGVTVLTDSAADGIEADGVRVGDRLLQADFVIAGIGVVPRVELAQAAGLEVDDGILTDARHETSAPRVFAAGDVARVDGVRVEHWHAAREGGERAALAMLGQPVTSHHAPWVFSEVAGHGLDVVGLAAEWDETRRFGDGDRFAVVHLARGRVVQVAIVDGALPVAETRALVERGSALDDIERMGVSAG